jgi:hypothetical protein
LAHPRLVLPLCPFYQGVGGIGAVVLATNQGVGGIGAVVLATNQGVGGIGAVVFASV